MLWVEVLAAFGISHLAGDFLLQTEWQAQHKAGGLRHGGPARRALFTHCATYLIAFAPALVWLADDLGAGVLWLMALIFVLHLLQDDGWVVPAYMRRVKRTDPAEHPALAVAVDQSLHAVVLALTALVVSA